jgi:dTDP-3-amino-3,4,6-trideoxy-alpha-D-glucose transaminase
VTVPLTRLDNSNAELMAELLERVEAVASRAAFVQGEEVDAFEREFAAYCDAREAVGVSSGTTALALALQAVGVGQGDEVLVPANSFIATAEAVTLAGAIPRFVDVEPDSQLISAATVEGALSPRTRAVIPVHLYGRTVELGAILALARRAGVAVIEDACQAHGARYKERRVGAIGDCGCFSFYPTKNLGGWGDGGAVVTNDPAIAERVRLLRSHGEKPRYRHRVPGTTARLDTIQAAVLRVKLRRLDDWNAARRRLGGRLSEALCGSAVELPPGPADGQDHVFHQYVVKTEDRDGLRAHLERYGVASAVHYPVPIHLTEAYAAPGAVAGSLPVTERLAHRICSLPIFPSMTPDELQRVGMAVAEFVPEAALLAAAS